ncbi:MAG: metal-dependent hydrolase, partial [Halocynthiibacter sp.]
MITAHLPSGYLLAKLTRTPRLLMPFAILGAVLPDFDMFWFHLVDNRAFHHHKYWVHVPGFWLPVAVFTLAFLYLFIRPRLKFPVMQ